MRKLVNLLTWHQISLFGFAGVDPFAEDAAEELEKAFAELKLSGLKLHPGKGHFLSNG